MNPFVLGGPGLWRLWTCHLVHFGPGHAVVNLGALGVPFALVRARDRMVLALVLVAPLLSLALLPGLDGGTYRGASGLACAAWSMAGFALARDRDRRLEGLLLLGFLSWKVLAEVLFGTVAGPGWVGLPAAHQWGMFLGALASPWLVRRS